VGGRGVQSPTTGGGATLTPTLKSRNKRKHTVKKGGGPSCKRGNVLGSKGKKKDYCPSEKKKGGKKLGGEKGPQEKRKKPSEMLPKKGKEV